MLALKQVKLKKPVNRFWKSTSGLRFFCRLCFAFLLGSALLVGSARPVLAEEPEPRKIPKEFVADGQHWQLAEWSGGKKVCDIYVRHDAMPTKEEIIEACGNDVYVEWITTPACGSLDGEASCKGLLAHLVGKEQHLFKEYVEASPMTIEVNMGQCLPGSWCEVKPEFTFIGHEPMPGHQIARINVVIGSFSTTCEGSTCRITVPLTADQGASVEYWAESDFGDSSPHDSFYFRNVFRNESAYSYRVDLLGDEWANETLCGSMIWQIFPPLYSTVPEVLSQPVTFRELNTNSPYLFLAGNLIRSGMVDASKCPENGMLANGFASPCGEQASTDQVYEWQNRYDPTILKAALKHDVPARVIKAVIAQESQFWPRSNTPYELGLGMITENGLDMLLRWNQDYYKSTCQILLEDERCEDSYYELDVDEQYTLKSALLKQVGTEKEIDVLAGMMVASEYQTNRLVVNATGKIPALVTSYEDMWKMTIANYYTGSGCLGNAISNAAAQKAYFTWADVVNNLSSGCELAKEYVEKVLGEPVSVEDDGSAGEGGL